MSAQTLSPADRVRTTRRRYAERVGPRAPGDTAYLAYLVVLVLAMVVIPLLIGMGRVLSQPEILSALQSPRSDRVVHLVSGVFLAAAAALGLHRGPAHLPPVLVVILAGNDLPRSRTLRRPFVGAALGVIVLVTVAGALVGTVLTLGGEAEVLAAVSLVGASAALGAIGATMWLAGQRAGNRHGWLLPASLLVATLITLPLPTLAAVTPWGWMAQTWPPTASGPPWALLPLVLVALVCLDRAAGLLDRVPGAVLLDQARRWEIVSVAAFTGDLSSALATFRSRPVLGRGWRAVPGVVAPLQYLVRDLVGAARTPVRMLTGLSFLTLGGLLTSLAGAGTPLPPWVLAGLGAATSFAALGTLTDGFRHAGATRWAPTLFGHLTGRLYLLHTAFPVLATVGCTLAGGVVARLIGWGAADLLAALLPGVLVVAVRAFDSVKGPLPLTLLTPVPSPVGDMSGVVVMAWQADALLLSVALGVGWTYAVTAVSAPVATVGAALALGIVVALTRGRLSGG